MLFLNRAFFLFQLLRSLTCAGARVFEPKDWGGAGCGEAVALEGWEVQLLPVRLCSLVSLPQQPCV